MTREKFLAHKLMSILVDLLPQVSAAQRLTEALGVQVCVRACLVAAHLRRRRRLRRPRRPRRRRCARHPRTHTAPA